MEQPSIVRHPNMLTEVTMLCNGFVAKADTQGFLDTLLLELYRGETMAEISLRPRQAFEPEQREGVKTSETCF